MPDATIYDMQDYRTAAITDCDACGGMMVEPAATDEDTGIAVCTECEERGMTDLLFAIQEESHAIVTEMPKEYFEV